MSLLNQVLRDLQGRQAALPAQQMGEVVQPVRLGRAGLPLWIYLCGVLSLVLVGLYFLWPVSNPPEIHNSPVVTSGPVPAMPVSPPVTNPPPPTQDSLQSSVRLLEESEAVRLVLEFSRPLREQPKVYLENTDLRVLLPEQVSLAGELPQPRAAAGPLRALKLIHRDQHWQLLGTLAADAVVEPVRLEADSFYGERLVIAIRGLHAASETMQAKSEPETESGATQSQTVRPEPVALAKKVVKLSPSELAAASYRNGQQAFDEGRLSTAENFWQQALRHDPVHLAARQQLIRALLVSDRALADALFAEGLMMHEPVAWRTWYARVLLSVAGPRAAAAVLMTTGHPGQESVELLALRAGLWQQATDFARAEADYRTLVGREPTNGLYRFGLAVALDQLANDTAAEHYLAAKDLGLKPELENYAANRLEALRPQQKLRN